MASSTAVVRFSPSRGSRSRAALQDPVTANRTSRLKAALKVIRLHQWSKNALVRGAGAARAARPVRMRLAHAPRWRPWRSASAPRPATSSTTSWTWRPIAPIPPRTGARSPRARSRRAYGPPLILGCWRVSVAISLFALPMSFFAMLVLYFVITAQLLVLFEEPAAGRRHRPRLALHPARAGGGIRDRRLHQRLAAGLLDVHLPEPGLRQAPHRAAPRPRRERASCAAAATTRRI